MDEAAELVRPALVYFSTHICAERFTLDFRLELAVTGKEIKEVVLGGRGAARCATRRH
jgi:hypothetical protein